MTFTDNYISSFSYIQMDVLFACWAFDNRWIFAIKNKCLEYIFTAPLMINLATLIAVFFQSVII